MKISRDMALKHLSDSISTSRHGLSRELLHEMSKVELEELYNELFEPIDLGDRFVITDTHDDQVVPTMH